MAKKKLACASCGMTVKRKMKTGGVAPKPFAAGIPYATGTGQFDGKNGMMKKGGPIKGRDISAKAALRKTAKGKGMITGMIGPNLRGAEGEYYPFTREGRKTAKAGTKGAVVETKTPRTIVKKKTGGSLKPVPSGNKGLAKLPTAVRNKMGYQKRGGSVKRK